MCLALCQGLWGHYLSNPHSDSMKHILRMFSFHRQGNCESEGLSDWQTGWQSQFVTGGALESKCLGSGFRALGQGARIIDVHEHAQLGAPGWAENWLGMKETRGQWEREREGVWEVGGLEDREVTCLQFLEQVSARKFASTFNQQHLRLTEREEIDLSEKVKPRSHLP